MAVVDGGLSRQSSIKHTEAFLSPLQNCLCITFACCVASTSPPLWLRNFGVQRQSRPLCKEENSPPQAFLPDVWSDRELGFYAMLHPVFQRSKCSPITESVDRLWHARLAFAKVCAHTRIPTANGLCSGCGHEQRPWSRRRSERHSGGTGRRCRTRTALDSDSKSGLPIAVQTAGAAEAAASLSSLALTCDGQRLSPQLLNRCCISAGLAAVHRTTRDSLHRHALTPPRDVWTCHLAT